jgi:curved DNA-binding protein CbpA
MTLQQLEDYYRDLGVSPEASLREIKEKHNKLADKYHPDRGSEPDEARMKIINSAYEVLGRESKRKEYDKLRGGTQPGKTAQEAAKKARAAKERADKVRAARDARKPSAEEAREYGDRIRGYPRAGDTSAKQPPPRPQPSTSMQPRTTPPPTIVRLRGRAIPTWVIVAVLAGIVALLTLAKGNSPVKSQPPPTPQQRAEERSTMTRIDQLHFECRVRYICNLAPYNAGDLPLYIKGMDTHLASYLEQRGYTDSWTVTGPYGESAKTIGHGGSEETKTREYVDRSSAGLLKGLRVPLIYSPVGLEAANIPAGKWPVTITWTLTLPSGKALRSLSYSLNFIECAERESYCQNVIYFLGRVQNTGTASKGIEAFSE